MATNKDFKVKSGLQVGTFLNSYNNATPTNGQLLIGDTTNSRFSVATLTQGSGISVTNAAGSITIAVSGIPNGGLTNSSLTIGSTNIALGATSTTLAGLTSVTSTGFSGALNGTVGATTPSTGVFTTLSASSSVNVRTTTSTNGYINIMPGGAAWSGYLEFQSHTGNLRQGYIGSSSTNASSDTGTIPYVAGTHAFTGALTTTSTITGTSFNSITGLSSTTPIVAGTAAIGVGTTAARADHVHPAQTTVTTNANLTGPITSVGNATSIASQTGTGTQFVMSTTPSINGFINITGSGAYMPASTTIAAASGPSGASLITAQGTAGTAGAAFITFHRPSAHAFHVGIDTDNFFKIGGCSLGAVSYKIWHEGVDGAGSGLDADLLDGQHGSYYAPLNAPVFTGIPRASSLNIGADTDIYLYESSTNALSIRTGGVGTEKYFTFSAAGVFTTSSGGITSTGVVGIGAPATGASLNITRSFTGATSTYGIAIPATVASDSTSGAYGVATYIGTQATAFTLGTLMHYNADQAAIGAGSTVTNQYGYVASAGLVGATNNYGFYGGIPAAANRWNFYAAGTANNAFAGNVRIGGVTAPSATLDVTGTIAATSTITGTSFNSITGLSSTTPIVAGTAAIGVGTTAARADHVHPVQTTITGNAGTATILATARTIGGTSFDGSANVTSFPVPGAIGGTTPSTGAFTTLTATGGVDKLTTASGVVSVAAATAPTTGQVLMATSGTTATWQTPAGGSTVTLSDDTATNATYYPSFATATSGTLSTLKVSSTKLTFNPSTGTLSATILNSLSDANFKTNVLPLVDSANVVKALNGVSFDWKDGSGSSYGLIAQEVQKIIPHAVSEQDGKLGVNYASVVPFLIETIKSQEDRIARLEAMVAKLVG